MRRCWVNFQCQGVLQTWLTVGQGPIVLSVGAGGGCLGIFSLIYHFSFLSPSLWETARYRLKYCLKGPLNPKQPTNRQCHVPKSLRIFYRIVPVDIYVPNPLRCFNCQRFGHHENNCPVDLGSVCANCGAGGHDHHTSACKNAPKCVNCGKDHVSRSSNCEIWKKEKEICKIKVTKNITYLEAKQQFESQTSDLDFTKIVQSLSFFRKRLHYSSIFKSNYSVGQTKVSGGT